MNERGCLDITLAGGGSGRIDRLLGIAALFERATPPTRWLTDYEEVRLVQREAEFGGWQGCTVSIFPVGNCAARMHSAGLQWPLDGLVFQRCLALNDTEYRVDLNDTGYRVDLNDTGYRVDLDNKDP